MITINYLQRPETFRGPCLQPILFTETNDRPAETTQVAPTILASLGLDPNDLQAVQIEGTQVLPGFDLGNDLGNGSH